MSARSVDLLLDERKRLVDRNLALRAAITKQELWMARAIKMLNASQPADRFDRLRLAQIGTDLLQEVREAACPPSTEGVVGRAEGEAATPTTPPAQAY